MSGERNRAGIHPTADGHIYISANTPRFWRALCEKTGLHALADNPRYDTVRKRTEHASEILPQLHQALATRSAPAWEALFGDEVPSAAARRIEDMFEHPQVLAEGIVGTIEHPVVGRYHGVAQSIKFSRTPGPPPFAAPMLGQHTDEIKRKS